MGDRQEKESIELGEETLAKSQKKLRQTSMDDFEILSKLGDGAYSSVYKVKRVLDNEMYALKKVKLHHLSDKEKENAINEVRILASIKHVNIISYKEAFVEPQTQSLCIVMEYADNGDLFQKITEHLKAKTYFPEQDIWKLFIQLVRGIKAMHDLNIMHRDLKSANVFLQKDFTAKLGDMNVSKVANKRGLNYTQTGTPYYASPEVWRDEPYDIKSDIWSLGCVLYEMIALKPPFTAEDMQGLFKRVTQGRFPRIPKAFSHDLWTMVKYLLQVSPQSRPNCDQIMNMPVFAKKFEKIFPEEHFYSDQNILLKTIKFPKNLMYLSDRLPKQNYSNFNTTVEDIDVGRARKTIQVQNKKEVKLPSIQNVKQTYLNSINVGQGASQVVNSSYLNQLEDQNETSPESSLILAQSPAKKRSYRQLPKTKTIEKSPVRAIDANPNANSLNHSLASNEDSIVVEDHIEITNQNIYIGKKKNSMQIQNNNDQLEGIIEEGAVASSKLTEKPPGTDLQDRTNQQQQLIVISSEKRLNLQTIDRPKQTNENNSVLPPLINEESVEKRNQSPLLLKHGKNHKLKASAANVSISQDYSQKKILVGGSQPSQLSSQATVQKLQSSHPSRALHNYHKSVLPPGQNQLEASESQERLRASPARIQEILNRYNIKQLKTNIKQYGMHRGSKAQINRQYNKYYINQSYAGREERGLLSNNSSVDLVIGQHLERSSKARDHKMSSKIINEESSNEDETISMMRKNQAKVHQISQIHNSSSLVLPKLDNSYSSKQQLQIEMLAQAYKGSVNQSPKQYQERKAQYQKARNIAKNKSDAYQIE